MIGASPNTKRQNKSRKPKVEERVQPLRKYHFVSPINKTVEARTLGEAYKKINE